MSKYRIRMGEKVYEMEVEIVFKEDYKTTVSKEIERKVQIDKSNETTINSFYQNTDNSCSKHENCITCPMPGVVLKVLLNEGETVKCGQSVIIIEAMKMENAITATKNGYIKKMSVSEGDSVSKGFVLFEIGE